MYLNKWLFRLSNVDVCKQDDMIIFFSAHFGPHTLAELAIHRGPVALLMFFRSQRLLKSVVLSDLYDIAS